MEPETLYIIINSSYKKIAENHEFLFKDIVSEIETVIKIAI